MKRSFFCLFVFFVLAPLRLELLLVVLFPSYLFSFSLSPRPPLFPDLRQLREAVLGGGDGVE